MKDFFQAFVITFIGALLYFCAESDWMRAEPVMRHDARISDSALDQLAPYTVADECRAEVCDTVLWLR